MFCEKIIAYFVQDLQYYSILQKSNFQGTVERNFWPRFVIDLLYSISGPDFEAIWISVFFLFAKLFVFFDGSPRIKKNCSKIPKLVVYFNRY
jgi:hypothetical protein